MTSSFLKITGTQNNITIETVFFSKTSRHMFKTSRFSFILKKS